MHGTYLLGGQRLAEQIDRRHLAAKHSLLVQLGRCTDIALIEGLQEGMGMRVSEGASRTFLRCWALTSFVDTNHAISVLDAN